MVQRKPNCTCTVCNKNIYRRPLQIASGNTYCSLRCCGKHQRKSRVCPVCLKTYTGIKRSCSRACANVARRGLKYTGENNKNKAHLGNRQKKQVAQKRGGVCEKCSENNYAILQIHHKMERARGGIDALSNLELLCPNCHMTHHLGFGLFPGHKSVKLLGP